MLSHPIAHALTKVAGAALLLACATGVSVAQTANIEKLKQMKVSGTDPNIPVIQQTGKNADQLRENLKRIKMPPGFKIDLYAVVPDARNMAVAPSTNMMFVGTRKSNVYAVTNRNSGDMATEVKEFAPSLKFRNPNAVCWTKDGFLIVVETNRVYTFPAAEFFYEGADVAVGEVVPAGQLIPVEEESFNHSGRVCRVGPDNKIYITLGQPYNVPPREKLALYTKTGIGGIVRMNQDGTGREVYATGVRNSVGLDFNPKDKTLWFTDNQTDGIGRRHTSRRNQPRHQGRAVLRLSLRREQDTRHRERIRQGPAACQYRQSGSDDRRTRGRSGHDFLYRQAVSGEVPKWILLRATRLMEPHQAGGRARAVHLTEG